MKEHLLTSDGATGRPPLAPEQTLSCEETEAATAYWRQLCGAQALPDYRAFDPIDNQSRLSRLVVLDVLRDGPTAAPVIDFRFRLIGGDVQDADTLVYRGRRLSELPQQLPGPQYREALREAVMGARPRLDVITPPCREEWLSGVRQLALPFTLSPHAPGAEAVDILMLFFALERSRGGGPRFK